MPVLDISQEAFEIVLVLSSALVLPAFERSVLYIG